MAGAPTPPEWGASLRAVLLAVLSLWAGSALAGEAAVGPGQPVDGERIIVGGRLFCLQGIDAPEQGQICRNAQGKDYDCGLIAKTALMDLTAGIAVRCVPSGPPGHGCQTAYCVADGYDLSEGMTYTGWAMADPATGGRYRRWQAEAKKKRRGLWKGTFDRPWDWRTRQPK